MTIPWILTVVWAPVATGLLIRNPPPFPDRGHRPFGVPTVRGAESHWRKSSSALCEANNVSAMAENRRGICRRNSRSVSESRNDAITVYPNKRAYRKLVHVDRATSLGDLAKVPGNRLEKLSGNRAGSYIIRINVQYRVCFRWESDMALDVEVVDYH